MLRRENDLKHFGKVAQIQIHTALQHSHLEAELGRETE